MTQAKEWLHQRKHVLEKRTASGDSQPTDLERELDAEFTRRDNEKRALSEHISQLVIQLSKTSNLQGENDALRRRLLELEGGNGQTRQSEDANEDRAAGIAGEQSIASLVEKHDRLVKKYNNLVLDCKEYEKAVKYLNEKCHRLKDRVRQWEEYKDHRMRKSAQTSHDSEVPTSSRTITPVQSNTSLAPDRVAELRSERGRGMAPATPPHMNVSPPALEPSYDLRDLEDLTLLNADGLDMPRNEVSDQTQTRLHSLQEVHERHAEAKVSPATPDNHMEADKEDKHDPGDEFRLSRIISTEARITSSQTTEDEYPPPQMAASAEQNEGEDDEPLFVSSRPVNRPRRRHERTVSDAPRQAVVRNGNGSSVPSLKQENVTSSSPAKLVSTKRHFTRTTSIDLDTAVTAGDTPRKRMRYSNPIRQPALTRNGTGQDSATRCTSVPLPDEADAMAEIDLINGAPLALERSHTDLAALDSTVHTDRSKSPSNDLNPTTSDDANAGRILNPISPNRQALPRTTLPAEAQQRRRGDGRGAKAVHLLSEDGDTHLRSSSRSRRSRSKSPGRKLESSKRLNNLLEKGTPKERSALNVLPTPPTGASVRQARPAARPQSPKPATPPQRRAEEARLVAGASSPRSPAVKDEPVVCVTPARARGIQLARRRQQDQEPLRGRPLEDLTLDDFKINVNYIGHHVALDVVRDRETRRCLPGCTRPCCTGAFRAMVQAGARPHVPAGIASSSPPGSQGSDTVELLSADDRRLLHHHLGASYSRELVNSMDDRELQDLLVEARTRLMGVRHGRHKRLFERARSPPGFWRADMPTTQEEESDRNEATRMVRERVRERWEDARRGGGRWIFRDE